MTRPQLQSRLTYIPETGDLIWRRGKKKKGKSAISRDLKVTFGDTRWLASRVILKLIDPGFLDHFTVVYQDGDPSNLKEENLFYVNPYPASAASFSRRCNEAPPEEVKESFKKESKTRSKPLPPINELRARFTYNPNTGEMAWREEAKMVGGAPRQTDQLGKPNAKGYRKVQVLGSVWYIHRLAWAIHYGEDPGVMLVDHIDGNPSNNRIKNLRLVTHARSLNRSNQVIRSSTGVRGVNAVTAYPGKFIAYVNFEGKRYHLGTFECLEKASKAVERKRKELGI